MKSRLAILSTVVLLALGGCVAPGSPPATASSTSASASVSPTPTEVVTASPSPTFIDRILLSTPSTIGPGWSQVFALPYGDNPDQLGTSLGGDGEGVRWGPDYGTQMPDSTWWFLDAAHRRLAQFSDTGQYLSDLVLPKKYLADGQYFQYASPFALADQTLVLVGTSIEPPSLLLVAPDRKLTRVRLAEWIGLLTTDGTWLYGFDEQERMVRVNPRTGAVSRVTAFTGQSGDTYSLAVGTNRLMITRGSTKRTVPVRAADNPTSDVHPWVQATMGADGVLAVLIAVTEEEEPGKARTLAGFVTIDRQGRVTPVETVPDLSSEADGGNGSHVGVRYGDSRPWLMFIDKDALRVYRRG